MKVVFLTAEYSVIALASFGFCCVVEKYIDWTWKRKERNRKIDAMLAAREKEQS